MVLVVVICGFWYVFWVVWRLEEKWWISRVWLGVVCVLGVFGCFILVGM